MMESLQDISALYIGIGIVTSMIFLFFARDPAHKAIQALSMGTAGGLRKIAVWAKSASDAMREKDRKVILESGVAKIEAEIHQAFTKMESANIQSLSSYPKVQLKLDENITKIEADYKECGQAKPQAPGWTEVIEAISRAKGSVGDRIIERMLGEIHKSAVSGEKKALSEFRDVASKRHKILNSMAPAWKRVEKLGKEVNHKVDQVIENSSKIDKYMNDYAKISKGGPESVDMLSSKMTKLFIVSLLVIFFGAVGAFVNFNLIALPMSELVPAGTRIAGLAVSQVSALVIVALELVLGIFLFEAVGVTNTFPQIAGMARNKRKILLYGSLFGLLFLSSVEASLAVLREALTEAKSALDHSLAGGSGAVSENDTNSQITLVGQALLGFVLPWILAVIAIPLEMFIEASQHVFAKIFAMLTTLFGHIANALAYLLEGFFNVLIHAFDIYIIVPMKIYDMAKGKELSTH